MTMKNMTHPKLREIFVQDEEMERRIVVQCGAEVDDVPCEKIRSDDVGMF